MSIATGDDRSWRHALRRHLTIALLIKLLALMLMWWFFFQPAHRPTKGPVPTAERFGLNTPPATLPTR